jgi:hypothetical protein
MRPPLPRPAKGAARCAGVVCEPARLLARAAAAAVHDADRALRQHGGALRRGQAHQHHPRRPLPRHLELHLLRPLQAEDQGPSRPALPASLLCSVCARQFAANRRHAQAISSHDEWAVAIRARYDRALARPALRYDRARGPRLTRRLRAGGQAGEIGSSAMPHKVLTLPCAAPTETQVCLAASLYLPCPCPLSLTPPPSTRILPPRLGQMDWAGRVERGPQVLRLAEGPDGKRSGQVERITFLAAAAATGQPAHCARNQAQAGPARSRSLSAFWQAPGRPVGLGFNDISNTPVVLASVVVDHQVKGAVARVQWSKRGVWRAGEPDRL